MRRLLFVLCLAIGTLAASATSALAEYPPTGFHEPLVAPNVVQAPAGTAFTGSLVLPLVLAAVLLLAIGWALVAFARRLRNAPAS